MSYNEVLEQRDRKAKHLKFVASTDLARFPQIGEEKEGKQQHQCRSIYPNSTSQACGMSVYDDQEYIDTFFQLGCENWYPDGLDFLDVTEHEVEEGLISEVSTVEYFMSLFLSSYAIISFTAINTWLLCKGRCGSTAYEVSQPLQSSTYIISTSSPMYGPATRKTECGGSSAFQAYVFSILEKLPSMCFSFWQDIPILKSHATHELLRQRLNEQEAILYDLYSNILEILSSISPAVSITLVTAIAMLFGCYDATRNLMGGDSKTYFPGPSIYTELPWQAPSLHSQLAFWLSGLIRLGSSCPLGKFTHFSLNMMAIYGRLTFPSL
ncbi:hypothetical protein NHQ30_000863 [Ciborinia camelliae]|nr:hypothetical protein NHQ30_000863 [Ciborinia camelliae]